MSASGPNQIELFCGGEARLRGEDKRRLCVESDRKGSGPTTKAIKKRPRFGARPWPRSEVNGAGVYGSAIIR